MSELPRAVREKIAELDVCPGIAEDGLGKLAGWLLAPVCRACGQEFSSPGHALAPGKGGYYTCSTAHKHSRPVARAEWERSRGA